MICVLELESRCPLNRAHLAGIATVGEGSPCRDYVPAQSVVIVRVPCSGISRNRHAKHIIEIHGMTHAHPGLTLAPPVGEGLHQAVRVELITRRVAGVLLTKQYSWTD